MKKQSLVRYYSFGTGMRYLLDARKGYPIKVEHQVLDNINRFLNSIEELELNVTQRASQELYEFKEVLEKAENVSLSETQARSLSKIMGKMTLSLS